MKILHTADWHLGKKIDRFSRIEEQCLVMEEIVQTNTKLMQLLLLEIYLIILLLI